MDVLWNWQTFLDNSIREQTAAAALPLTTAHILMNFSYFFFFYCLHLPRYNHKGICLEKVEGNICRIWRKEGGRESPPAVVSGFWPFAVVWAGDSGINTNVWGPPPRQQKRPPCKEKRGVPIPCQFDWFFAPFWHFIRFWVYLEWCSFARFCVGKSGTGMLIFVATCPSDMAREFWPRARLKRLMRCWQPSNQK